MSGFVSTRAFGPETRTLADVLAESKRRSFEKSLSGSYSQTADQLARGPELARAQTAESLDFKPAADRYDCSDTGQYLLDLPPTKK